MNILIVDDDDAKIAFIRNSILAKYNNVNIRSCKNYRNVNDFIGKRKKYIDLIILDWSFPLNETTNIIYGLGNLVLEILSREPNSPKVVLCSSDNIEVSEYYPFIIGNVLFDRTMSVVEQIQSYVEQVQTNHFDKDSSISDPGISRRRGTNTKK